MSDELQLLQAVSTELEPLVRETVAVVAGSSPVQESLGLLGDVIRGRRAKTQLRILVAMTHAIRDAGLTAHVVPDKTLVPLLEFGGLEDPEDADMVTRWANLLANAATPSDAGVRPAFAEILRQLESIEAAVMEDIVHPDGFGHSRPYPFFFLRGPNLDVETENFDNLERLGLLRFGPAGGLGPTWEQIGAPRAEFVATALGVAFVRACRRPQPPEK